jgi:beta-xylosidase
MEARKSVSTPMALVFMNSTSRYLGEMNFQSHKCNLVGIEKVSLEERTCLGRPNQKIDTPFVNDYSLTEQPNHLRLYGGPYNLSVPASPTMFLRKQTHRHCRWETMLSFQPTAEETEAGTVVWLNYFTYSSMGIRKDSKGRFIRFRPSEGDVVEHRLDTNTAVTLTIDCGTEYRFGYHEGTESDIHWIGSVSNSVATAAPPVGANFTGMMLGLYAFGERQRCLAPADFAYAEFK